MKKKPSKRKKRGKQPDPATQQWIDETLKPAFRALMIFQVISPSVVGAFTDKDGDK